MSPFGVAFAVEGRKAAAGQVTAATTALLVLGVAAIAGGMSAAARSGNAQVLAKLGPAAELDGWDGLIAIVLQITAAAGVLAFGVALSWIVGREFADDTIAGLFALPIPRTTTALAKLGVYLVWTAGVAAALTLTVLILGPLLGLGPPGPALTASLGRLATLTVLSAMIATPAAWAATIGRGILPGVATTVVIIAVAQIMAVAGTGAWFPFTAPALWAIAPQSVSAGQLALVLAVPAVSGLLTVHAWATLQLDR